MTASRPTPNNTLVAAIFLATIIFSPPALADPADDIVLILGYDKYYDNLSSLTVNQAMEKLTALKIPGPSDALPKLEDDARSYKVVFLGAIAKSYRARFTPSELGNLLSFYKSPLGQKVGDVQGPVKDDVVAASRNLGVYIGVEAAQLAK
ncbi:MULTISPECIES: DUF2059 domain-containing protein [unclassified Mesorhizobium]|uniref:DUF2059 domain-containing protein n=1 Tax=unclassified Mesorhizobium TaxID=325217 RepID=UPI000FCCBD94|nr:MULTISPECIES: DUF2059 domain-containing protein [unclassified Mesorhizobium]RUX98040.1 DUF2059 domain-containing protein [Mesorhizobium sp. M7D.F.Ca.US.004.01.2.1]RVA35743.1 DUF2059 domain-containing protein [Mesorhizobium sp. M7D.F.Ca.US.004.03.1.1]